MSGGVTVVLGSQWGDEGKGKLVDILAQQADVVARCQGGNNAGHTIVVDGVKFDFHMLPSGLVNPDCISVIGNGVVVHLPSLFQELENTEKKGIKTEGRIFLSDRAHLVFDVHQIVDGLREQELGRGGIGTTKKGIGPAYSSKASRSGLRVHHLFAFDEFAEKYRKFVENRKRRYGHFEHDVEAELAKYKEYAQRIKPIVIDSIVYVNKAVREGKRVLVEGANACMLDIDFGTYPYVTSSNTTIGGVCTGLGLPPQKVKTVIGVVKAYTTRVGGGPFPTELLDATGEHLQNVGQEWGVTTGRKRRCGWLDVVVLRYSHMINGYTSLNLTKLDVLSELAEVKIGVQYTYTDTETGAVQRIDEFPASLALLERCAVEYETLPGWQCDISKVRTWAQLPPNAQAYIRRVEELVGAPIQWVGVAKETAMSHIEQEVAQLQEHIKRLGSKDAKSGKYTVKYGVFVKDDQVVQTFEAPFGTLKAAKKRKIVDYQGELLLSPAHDNVDIILLTE
ncbi:Adenylosuccinate synthase [Sorochytrium milnesiophthora]